MGTKIKAPGKWVHVKQGPTTAVYFLQAGENVLGTMITHHWPKPMAFRNTRRLGHEVDM